MWKSLSDDEKTSWNARASPEKESPVKWVNHDDASVGASNQKIDICRSTVNSDPSFDRLEAELQEEHIDESDVSDEPTKPVSKTKKSKEPKEPKDSKPKKKRVSGYILYQKVMRESAVETLEENRDDDAGKIKQSEVMSELGKMWKALDDEERQAWNEKAEEIKDSSSNDD